MAREIRTFFCLIVFVCPAILGAWSSEQYQINNRSPGQFHNKRHMIQASKSKPLVRTARAKSIRKKDTHSQNAEEEPESDDVVSVAVGPPIQTNQEKNRKVSRTTQSPTQSKASIYEANAAAAGLIKEVMAQIGQELIAKQVDENFVFGQYVGNTLKNLTSNLKIKMQHDILELIMKYQKMHMEKQDLLRNINGTTRIEKNLINANDTEDVLDFSSLANIVG